MTEGIAWRLFLRSFFIQGGWNYRTLQGIGFAWSLLTAERGGNAAIEAERLTRHSTPFNSHPYLASTALGAVARMEEEGRRPEEIRRFKDALGSLLGSLGDGLVWGGWRPVSVLAALGLALLGFSPTTVVAVFLLMYNVVHLGIRLQGARMGVRMGIRVGTGIGNLDLPVWTERIRTVGVLLVGLVSGILLARGAHLSEVGVLLPLGGILALLIGQVMGEKVRRWIPVFILLMVLCGFLPIADWSNG